MLLYTPASSAIWQNLCSRKKKKTTAFCSAMNGILKTNSEGAIYTHTHLHKLTSTSHLSTENSIWGSMPERGADSVVFLRMRARHYFSVSLCLSPCRT